MQGLVANIDLMESRNRIAATGLQLTEHEFANLSVAAQRYATTSGKDVNEVMNQLTEAITSGSAEALQRFGLNLSDTTSKAATQESALRALDEQYGQLDADVNSAAAGIAALSNSLENATTDFIEGTQTGANFSRTMDELNTTAEALANSFGIEVSNGFTVANAAGEIFSNGLNGMVRAMSRLMQAVNEFGNMNFARAFESIQSIGNIANEIAAESIVGRATADINQMMRNVRTETGAATTQGSSTLGGTGGGGGARRGLISANEMSTIIQREDAARMREFWAEQDAANARRIEQLRFEGEEAMRLAEIYAQDNEQKRQALDLAEQALNTRRKEAEEAARAAELERRRTQEQQRFSTGLNYSNQLMQEGLNLLVMSQEKGKTATKQALKEWLKGFAMQEVMKGGAALAEAIGMTILNPAGAGTKYSESAYHFALASAAGGASAAIPSQRGSAGGASGGQSTQSGVAPGGTSLGSGERSIGTVVINVNGQALLTEGQIGREVQNALNAYQVRYA
jgi:hypothetical protein